MIETLMTIAAVGSAGREQQLHRLGQGDGSNHGSWSFAAAPWPRALNSAATVAPLDGLDDAAS